MQKTKYIALFSLGFFIFLCSISYADYIERVKSVAVYTAAAKQIGLLWDQQSVSSEIDYFQVKVMKKKVNHYKIVKKVKTTQGSVWIKHLKPETTYYFKVRACDNGHCGPYSVKVKGTTDALSLPAITDAGIIFLHHSTGENIWNGGVASWFDSYNSANNTDYRITEQAFPKDYPYGWANYPYDYWNIWVNHEGNSEYQEEPTLEILTQTYNVIVFKHCFPVSYVEPNIGADITSDYKSIENYELQYNALKEKMHEFPDNKFIVWTGAALIQGETDAAHAQRAQEFFNWVKNTWDEPGDNIYVFDFYSLETEGSIYMKDSNAAGDSHPNETFSAVVAPKFSQRIVNVVNNLGDSTSLTGE